MAGTFSGTIGPQGVARGRFPRWFLHLPCSSRRCREFLPQPHPKHVADAEEGEIHLFQGLSGRGGREWWSESRCVPLISSRLVNYCNLARNMKIFRKVAQTWWKLDELSCSVLGCLSGSGNFASYPRVPRVPRLGHLATLAVAAVAASCWLKCVEQPGMDFWKT